MFVALLFSLLSIWYAPEHPPGPPFRRPPLRDTIALKSSLQTLLGRPLSERIAFWTEAFMGTPYAIDPAGEGHGLDPDPPLNTEQVDCETYVEQVLALSFSSSLSEVHNWLDRMRYRGGVRAYENRFYTMALQWIPGNLKLGYLKLQGSQKGLHLKTMRKYIDPNYRWATVFRRRLKELGKNAPRGMATLRYFPLAALRAHYTKLNTPAMGLIVGARQIKNPFLITHMGFILKNKKGHLVWRHASRSATRYRVEERLLSKYLTELATYFRKNRRRMVMGAIVYTLVDPPRIP